MAKKVHGRIAEVARGLCRHPAIGRPGRVPGTRERAVKPYPYLLVYAVGEEAITVLAVFHMARDFRAAWGAPLSGR